MDRRWSFLGLALLVGVAGFALAIGLDQVEGSSSWPGGPEIVVVIAAAAALAAAVGLAWAGGRRSLPGLGVVLLVTAGGFGLGWLGFQGLYLVGGGCGYTPDLSARVGLEGTWDEQSAREGLRSQGLTLEEPRGGRRSASTTLDDGTTFRVSVSEHRRQANASEPDIRLSASFWSEEGFASPQDADNWTREERERLEGRFQTFLSGFEDETGWEKQGNVTWAENTIVC